MPGAEHEGALVGAGVGHGEVGVLAAPVAVGDHVDVEGPLAPAHQALPSGVPLGAVGQGEEVVGAELGGHADHGVEIGALAVRPADGGGLEHGRGPGDLGARVGGEHVERPAQVRLAVAEVAAEREHGGDGARVALDRDGHPADGQSDRGSGLVHAHADATHQRVPDLLEDPRGDPLGEGLDEVVGAGADLLVHGRDDLGVVHGAGEDVGAAGRGGREVQDDVDRELLADLLLRGEDAVMAPGADAGDLDAVQASDRRRRGAVMRAAIVRVHRRLLRRSRSPTRTAARLEGTSWTRTAQAPCSAL